MDALKSHNTSPKEGSFKKELPLSTIKLHQSENAWKPSFKIESTADENEKLKKFIQGVMNKLTFQKFKVLLAQLKTLDMDTEDKMSLFVDLIFENAVYEPRYSALYANLCKHLENIEVQVNKENIEQVNFLSLIIARCQSELNKKFLDKLQENLVEVSLKCSSVPESEEKHQYQNEYHKQKIRYFGTLRFFGEIYNLYPHSNEKLHDYLKLYLYQKSEESLEYLCVLMKTSGMVLDRLKVEDTQESKIEKYFLEIKSILSESLLSSRIKFMLMDLIELRENNWIPRIIENKPKTVDQIREEAMGDFKKHQERHKMILQKKRSKLKKKKNKLPDKTCCELMCECAFVSQGPSNSITDHKHGNVSYSPETTGSNKGNENTD